MKKVAEGYGSVSWSWAGAGTMQAYARANKEYGPQPPSSWERPASDSEYRDDSHMGWFEGVASGQMVVTLSYAYESTSIGVIQKTDSVVVIDICTSNANARCENHQC